MGNAEGKSLGRENEDLLVNMENVQGKSLGCANEDLLGKVKKIYRRTSLRLLCLLYVSSIILIILTISALDPFIGESETLSNAAFLRRGSFDSCKGRRIFVYDLPPDFNIVVYNENRCYNSLIPKINLCPRFSNGGYGVKLWSDNVSAPAESNQNDFDKYDWYDTDSYMQEMIFHTRLQRYRCLTKDASQADAFFVPFYTGLLALDFLYNTTDYSATFEQRKNFGQELLDWLEENGGEYWSRFGGRDHLIVKGRTTWDFSPYAKWGTGFSELPYASNMTSLLLERRSAIPHEMAIPYPTSFHPESPQRLKAWIENVENSTRKYLFSYVGAPRPDSRTARGLIGNACINAGDSVCNLVNCSIVRCSHDPVSIYKSFLATNFCLQPKGDTPTRRSTFDCLIAGTIPVFFDEDAAYTQYLWHLPRDPASYSVYIPVNDLRNGVSIHDVLKSYSPQRIIQMRKNIISIIPNLIYNGYENDPTSASKDAYEISLERVLERFAVVRKELAQTNQCRLSFKGHCLVG